MKAIKDFIKKYSHAWVLLYTFFYFPWFFWLEEKVTLTTKFANIYTPLDDLIPFCEYFIIPYYIWFAYVVISIAYFLFKRPRKEYYEMTAFLFIGMTICLLICTLYPNGQTLRPPIDPNKNIFCQMIVGLYKTDTCTNVFPSIHVYASLGVDLAWRRSPVSKEHRWIRPVSFLIMISICLSTVFLKQHSVLDGLGAFVLAVILYFAVYQSEPLRISLKERAKSKKRIQLQK